MIKASVGDAEMGIVKLARSFSGKMLRLKKKKNQDAYFSFIIGILKTWEQSFS